ncbi:MAG: GGDEF domain-containing protein [Quadrisphaera sp.]
MAADSRPGRRRRRGMRTPDRAAAVKCGRLHADEHEVSHRTAGTAAALSAAGVCAAASAVVAAVSVAAAPGASVPLPVVAAIAVAPPALLGVVAGWRRRWWASAGGSLIAAANVLFYGTWIIGGAPSSSPLLHVGYVLGYTALLRSAGLRSRGGRRGVVLDALIVVSGPALVVLSTLARPLLVQDLTFASAVSLVYVGLDLGLLLLVVRGALAGATPRLPAFLTLVAAVLLLGGNLAFLLQMVWVPPSLLPWLAVPFSVAYALLASECALSSHRGYRAVASSSPDATGQDWRTAHKVPGGTSRTVLVLLPTAACLPAAALVVQGVSGHTPDWQVLGPGAVLTAVLSTLRLHTALRVSAEQAVRLERLAHRDELTDLPNRRRCSTAAQALLASGTGAVALALLDLDRFKAVNDTLGHDAGDALLRDATAAWRRVLPPTAGLYRWGGEEFVVLLAGDDAERSEDLLDDVRRAVPGPHTVSAGLARRLPDEEFHALLTRADGLLYEAKTAGRDRVRSDAEPTTAVDAAEAGDAAGGPVPAARTPVSAVTAPLA